MFSVTEHERAVMLMQEWGWGAETRALIDDGFLCINHYGDGEFPVSLWCKVEDAGIYLKQGDDLIWLPSETWERIASTVMGAAVRDQQGDAA